MLQMRSVYPTAQDVLSAAPRKIAGVLLMLFNGEGTTRFHPKNLRNFLVEAYRGPQEDRVVAHVLDALEILKREKFIFQDYRDVVDSEWLALTEDGLAVRDALELQRPNRDWPRIGRSFSLAAGNIRNARRRSGDASLS